MILPLLDLLWYWLWHRPASAICGGKPRSSQWPAVRRAHLAKHPRCAATGSVKGVEVHHIIPFHLLPEMELDEENLITLRRDVHLLLGHNDSWKSFNKHVADDARWLLARILARP